MTKETNLAPRIRATISLASLIGLAACSMRTSAPAPPELSVTSVSSTPTTSPPAPSASVPFSRSILAAQLDSNLNSMTLAPVDPATGLRLSGYPPIDLGTTFVYAFAPGGRSLVFTKYVSTTPSRGELHFLDLSAWKDDFAILLLSARRTTALALSPDGSLLAVATAQPDGGSLWLVDAERRVVLAHIQTQAPISITKFTPDNKSLMDYEAPVRAPGDPGQTPPAVAMRSASDLTPQWSKSLTAVHDGFEPNPSFGGDPSQPGVGSIFRPAVAFAPDMNALYILHADAPKLTRVDFDRKTVLTLDIRPLQSGPNRPLVLPATTANARGQNGIELQARISPDGTKAYVDGVQTMVAGGTGGTGLESQTALHLRAIRLKDATEIYQSTVAGANLDLSPDGTRLLLPQVDQGTGSLTGTMELDASSGTTIGQYPDLSLQFATLMDGSPILLSSAPSLVDPKGTKMSATTPNHQLLGSWTSPQSAQWLIDP